jgi:putative transposon-encoded protein
MIVKTNNLTKVKVGVQNLIVKEEIEKVMADRLAQFGSYRIL